MSNGLETVESLQKAWRIALPQNCLIEFEDLALGPQIQNLNTEVGDFVLRRSDGLFTYQIAVVVDDAEQNITHIVRGQDLLSNTARQIYLQELLGYERPKYLHLPLVLDEHGEKLSKQTLATQINTQDEKHSLIELRKAAKHLGLKHLPDGENVTIAEWLLAATHAWRSELLFLKAAKQSANSGLSRSNTNFFLFWIGSVCSRCCGCRWLIRLIEEGV
jgi:glutamyl-Q tRNA(Asp) synthetase